MALLPFVQVGASILGSIMGSKSADKANRQNAQDAALNRKLQMDTLRNQIQWKVEDAKKAGISPLAALGSVPYSYSPASSNFTGYDYSSDFQNIGQDLTRAIQAGGSNRQRIMDAKNAAMEGAAANKLSLEHMHLQNEYLRSQIARMNSGQIGPGVPEFRSESSPSAIPPGSVLDQPSSVVVGAAGQPARQPGSLTDYQFGEAAGGRYTLSPAADIKQRIEDTPMEWTWMLRNGIVPSDDIFRDLERQHPSRPGYEWRYDPFQGQFWQRPLSGRRRHY